MNTLTSKNQGRWNRHKRPFVEATHIERVLTQDIEMIVAPVIQGLVYRGDEVSAKSVLEMLDGSTQGVMLRVSMEKLAKFKRTSTKN